MISYSPFWVTLKAKKVSTYALVKYHHISNGTLYRMRKNAALSTATIDDFCRILDCRVEDILLYTPTITNGD